MVLRLHDANLSHESDTDWVPTASRILRVVPAGIAESNSPPGEAKFLSQARLVVLLALGLHPHAAVGTDEESDSGVEAVVPVTRDAGLEVEGEKEVFGDLGFGRDCRHEPTVRLLVRNVNRPHGHGNTCTSSPGRDGAA